MSLDVLLGRLLREQNRVLWWFDWRLLWVQIAGAMLKEEQFMDREKPSWRQLFKCILGLHKWRLRKVSKDYHYDYCICCLKRRDHGR